MSIATGVVVVTVSSSGGKWTARDNPRLALSPAAIVDEAVESATSGASMVHLHARDALGNPTFDPDIMDYIVREIRSRSDIVVQVSTGNLPGEPQSLPSFLRCAPELASFNLKDKPAQSRERARIFKELNIRPVIEVAELEMVKRAGQFLDEGLFRPPLMFELVFDLEGQGLSAQHVLQDLLARVNAVETIHDAVWSVTRGAEHRQTLAAAALGMGGWVRGGMEDSLLDCRGDPAASSVQLVRELTSLAAVLGRRVASRVEARGLLGLQSRATR